MLIGTSCVNLGLLTMVGQEQKRFRLTRVLIRIKNDLASRLFEGDTAIEAVSDKGRNILVPQYGGGNEMIRNYRRFNILC